MCKDLFPKRRPLPETLLPLPSGSSAPSAREKSRASHPAFALPSHAASPGFPPSPPFGRGATHKPPRSPPWPADPQDNAPALALRPTAPRLSLPQSDPPPSTPSRRVEQERFCCAFQLLSHVYRKFCM